MGVGQPLSMKLDNVHLPQPHPNGGFCDPSLGGGLVLLLCSVVVVVVGLSNVTNGIPLDPATRDIPFGVISLLS